MRVSRLAPVVVLGVHAACAAAPPPPPVRPFVRSSPPRSGLPPAVLSSADLRAGDPPPAVESASECPGAIADAVRRLRRGNRAFHFGPLCTQDYGGQWAAVVATGSTNEATEVWVVLKGERPEPEVRRVRRTPAGVKLMAGTIRHGIVYLVGESLVTQEQPGRAEVLLTFGVPWPGQSAEPSVLQLAPSEAPLIGARDRADLEQRLANLPPTVAPESGEQALSALERMIQGGPRALIAQLPVAVSVPVVRAWQLGVYERLVNLHAEIDPANSRLGQVAEIVRAMGDHADCSSRDRCAMRPEPSAIALPDAAVRTQILLRRDGANTILAAVFAQGQRPEPLSHPTSDRLAQSARDNAPDRALAEELSLGGSVTGQVLGISRGPWRVLAFDVRRGEQHETAVYLTLPDRAPRRMEDYFSSLERGARELYAVDMERNNEPELLTVHRPGTDGAYFTAATLLWPPAVSERSTYPRLDLMRAMLGAHSMEEAERGLQSWQPAQADQASSCAALERLAAGGARGIAAAVPGTFTSVQYGRAGLPTVGTPRRVTGNELRAADPAQLLGPFATARCDGMLCDWFQGWCRLGDAGAERGYFWFTGRRASPVWGVSVRQGGW